MTEAEYTVLCTQAGLTPWHVRITLLHRTLDPYQIAQELTRVLTGAGLTRDQIIQTLTGFPDTPPTGLALKHVNRRRRRELRRMAAEVSEGLEDAAAMLGKARPELFDAGRDFAHQLVECVRNRGSYDERPPGVSGVAPAQESKPVRAGRIISGDDSRLRQSPASCLRLYTRELIQPIA